MKIIWTFTLLMIPETNYHKTTSSFSSFNSPPSPVTGSPLTVSVCVLLLLIITGLVLLTVTLIRRRRSHMSEVNIVLLGKTGSGKSASGNTIIGGDERPFEEDFSPSSVTEDCESAQTEVDGQTITVIDTVGLSDTSVKITDVQTKIEQIFHCTNDGVDVFLLVIKVGQTFTEESSKAEKWIQENFGTKFSKHTIVLFTHGDQLHEPIERYLSKCEILRSVVDQCSGGFHVFNNKVKKRSQVTELLEKINTLREMNRNRRYTEQDYKEIQDQILKKKCLSGAAVGGGVGAVAGGVMAAKAGAVALTVGGAVIGAAAGGAVLAGAAVGFGMHLFARKYICKSETGENKKQN